MTSLSYFATAPKHLESLLAEELRALGAADAAETRGGVRFGGDLALAYRICLWSRVANRVLLVLARFPVPDADALYRGVQAVDWSAHFDVGQTFAVDFLGTNPAIAHSHFGALKVKDAIADQFRARTGERPSVDTERPDLRINLHLAREEATLSLDLSGDSLHRRGYRSEGGSAPLKGNLAAAILLRAGWPEVARAGGTLIDPMCGSGTLPIEAALIAADRAPGLAREHWGFLGWRGHDAAAWAALLHEARARAQAGLATIPPIRGYDRDEQAVRIAQANVARAGLAGQVAIARGEVEACAPAPDEEVGLVIVNPPYGERLGEAGALPALYATLGRVLKERFLGWRAAVFTGNPELGKKMGLRAERLHTLFNGPIECKLLHFHLEPSAFVSDSQGPRPLPPEQRGEGARMLANRLQKNSKQLKRWLAAEDIRCYRLYDADMPEYALAIDVYESDRRYVHVQEYEAPASVDPHKARLRLREALGVIPEVLGIGPEQMFFKLRRRQKGAAQYERLAETRRFHEVQEDGCRLWVNFEDYLDTGLFLDHRITRRLLGEWAKGTRFLNLFAYTGAATVHAARGGALATTTVDMSNTYLEWARRNLVLNGLAGPDHELIQADCLKWLETQAGRRRYDLIFVDPPSFSSSKRMEGTFDVQRDHVALIRAAMRLLAPGGLLVFSNNLRSFKLDSQALAGLDIEDITRATLPRDFERNPKIHRCWKIRAPQAR